jgi:cysteine-rich repeat protein
VKEGREECDDGNQSDADDCLTSCRTPVCGNGLKEGREECDDGNTGSDDSCTRYCRLPVCGNGIREGFEACDSGEVNSNLLPDACRTDCTLPRCGDGVTDYGEQCDGGGDCTPECILLPFLTRNREEVIVGGISALILLSGGIGWWMLRTGKAALPKAAAPAMPKPAPEEEARTIEPAEPREGDES